MGVSTQRASAIQQQTAAQAETTRAGDERQYNERVLGAASQMLGTDEQVAGYNQDARLAQYQGRYSVDDATVQSLKASHKNNMRNAGFAGMFTDSANAANSLLDQAEAAAKAGNWDEAEKLRTQAQSGLGMGGQLNQAYTSALKLGGPSVDTSAKSILTGPQAQIVGQQVRTARNFQDWNSTESTQFRQNLSESGERSIAAEAQSALRQSRDFGLQRGAGRMAGAAAAIEADTMRKAATQRAQVHSDVNQFFAQYRDQYARDAVGFAQSWLSGQAGVREDFQNAMTNIHGMTAEMYSKGSALAAHFADQAQAENQANQEKRGALYGAAIQAGAGLLGMGIGAITSGGGQQGQQAGQQGSGA